MHKPDGIIRLTRYPTKLEAFRLVGPGQKGKATERRSHSQTLVTETEARIDMTHKQRVSFTDLSGEVLFYFLIYNRDEQEYTCVDLDSE